MKKIPTNKWNPVKLDGISFENNLEGLIGIEECLDYNLDDLLQNNKKTAKRKNDKKEQEEELEPSPKKLKEVSTTKNAQKKKKVKQVIKQKEVKITDKPVEPEDVFSPSKQGDSSLSTEVENDSEKESENEDETSSANVEFELSQSGWGPLGLPVEIQKAIHELKFKEPTPIQAITLPPAILGRRDILGAAETGSGKTLAFGLPIVTGIMKLKKEGTDNTADSESELSEVEDDDDENDEDDDNDDEDNDEDDGSNSEESAEDEEIESESDFEENDEDVEELNDDGIGCVKSVNNAEFDFQKQLKPLYALILTPTRELAVQIRNHLIAICKYTDIRVAVIVGGMAAVKQERVLGKGPEIVVATPGRLWELLQQGNPHLGQIDNIKYLAIDETDRMVEKGHFQELHQILERINTDESKRQKRQNFVFSATLTLVHELPKHLVRKNQLKLKRGIKDVTPQQKLQKLIEMLGITDPKVVDITQGNGTPVTLTECRITCNIDEKDYYVYYFLQRHPGRTLIFCNSIGCVRRLTTILSLLSCQPLPLHSSMQQRQRLKNLDRFRDSVNGILVATDVAARGLDIASVAHVLHYQTPRTAESYVHRSGRTARASQEGLTLLLVEPAELQQYLRLCRTLGKTEDIPLFPIQDNYLNAVKERVNCARDLDKLELKVKKTNSEVGWLQKAADDMDMILDEVTSKYDIKEAQTSKKAADYKRKHLAALLSKQIFPRGFSGKYPLATGELLIPTTLTTSESSTASVPETAIEVMKGSISATGKSKTVGWKNPKGYFKKREVKLGAEKRQERRDKKKRANANSDGNSRKQGNSKKNRRN